MKNDLTCGVVRDLLPSYVEGMTSDETNAAVEAHLAACPDCAARRDAMTSPAEPAEAAEQSREVDYLKTVKRKSGRRVVIAVLCTLAVMLAGCALKVFVIGTPAQEQDLFVAEAVDENGILRLSISTPASATAFWGWTVDTADGVANISARSVLVSPLFPNGGGTVEIAMDGIREVRLCGRTVWQDGTLIQERVARLYETRTPYVGDMPALNRVATAMNIQSGCGPYTNSLQTSHEPYGWTLEFSNVYTEKQAAWLDETMEYDLAPLMMALVENLGEVSWTYRTQDSALQTRTVTLSQVNETLPRPVKDYAASPADPQHLLDLLRE